MTTASPDLAALTAKAAAGDRVAWAGLLRFYSAEVRGYIKRQMTAQLRGICDDGDIWQDVCLAVARSYRSFQPQDEDAARRWLLTLARNRIIDLIREASALKRGAGACEASLIDLVHSSVILQLEDLAVYSRTPSQSAVAGELRSIVSTCVQQLEPHHQEVIQMRYLQGMSPAEAAVVLQRTPKAVTSLCARALSALRSELGRAGLA